MISIKKYALLALLSFAVVPMFAQTVKWSVKPSYDKIEEYNNTLMKVKINGRSGLIDRDGQVVVKTYADSITNTINGYALILEKIGSRYRLSGILHDGNTFNVKDTYFVGKYAFYSEDRLPVMDERGFYGFLDTYGNLVVNCNYASVFPYTDGLASVVKNSGGKMPGFLGDKGAEFVNGLVKKTKEVLAFDPDEATYIYINPSGYEVKMPYKMVYASPFYEGKATIVTKDRERILIDKEGTNIRTLKEDETYQDFVDFGIKAEMSVPSTVYDGPTTFTELNNYGYVYKEKVLIPAQFSSAYPFKNGYAIAAVNGKYGILTLINGQFQCTGTYATIPSSNPDYDALVFKVFTPSSWAKTPVTLRCNVEGFDTIEQVQPEADSYNFRTYSFLVPKKGKRVFSLYGDGLTVWNQYMSDESVVSGNSETVIDDIAVSVSSSSVRADSKDLARVSVIVTNNSAEDIENLRITLSGGGLSTSTKTEPVAIGESIKIPVTLSAKGQSSAVTREITVVLAVEGNSRTVQKKVRVTIRPFFE